MKARLLLSLIFILAVIFLRSSEEVLATVGGPTYISDIVYHIPSNSVYYTETDDGGQGCPPIVHSLSLTKMEHSAVKTCDEVSQQFFLNEGGEEAYRQFIVDTYQNLSYLGNINYIGSVSLRENHIDINVEFISENVGVDGEVYFSEFEATISQDGKILEKTQFRGCSKDQPHIFEGYRIPDTNAIAILISSTGDCLEGGYIREVISLVRGIKYYDTNIIRDYKRKLATDLNIGNMVVYAAQKNLVNDSDVAATSTVPLVTQKNVVNYSDVNVGSTIFPTVEKKLVITIILLATFFIIGAVLGYLVGKKSMRS